MTDDRERVWMAHRLGDHVQVRKYAVLAPGEHLDKDDPPTVDMTRAEWEARHGEFDCRLDGTPVTPRPGVGMPVV